MEVLREMQELVNSIFGSAPEFGTDFVLLFWTVLIIFNLIAMVIEVFTGGTRN